MLREAMIEHCAPTLAGIKTGNLFSVHTEKDITDEIRSLNGILTKKGLRLIPVKKAEKYTLVYLYRPKKLRNDLCRPEAAEILKEKGYHCEDPNCCLVELVKHLEKDRDFPHEIGLFLGYPPKDVKCFMDNPCKGVKCSGCWKAYTNSSQAEKTFRQFKKCTEVYCRKAKGGRPLENMVVAE